MINQKKKLCIFIHFGTDNFIPTSVIIYLTELKKYFNRCIVVTNERHIINEDEIVDNETSLLKVKNEGYDLGMFYKAFQTIDPNDFIRIACINDSNILLNELKQVFSWSTKNSYDFWGIIDSHQKPEFSTHENNHHIQSHFLVFEAKAIQLLPSFFQEIDIPEIYKLTDPKQLRETVINKWEIGLSQFFKSKGLSIGSFINTHSFTQLHGHSTNSNATLKLYPELIKAGYPLLKKKVITKGKVKDIFRNRTHWTSLVRQYGNQGWEIDQLFDELHRLKANHGNQPLIKFKRHIRKILKQLKSNPN